MAREAGSYEVSPDEWGVCSGRAGGSVLIARLWR